MLMMVSSASSELREIRESQTMGKAAWKGRRGKVMFWSQMMRICRGTMHGEAEVLSGSMASKITSIGGLFLEQVSRTRIEWMDWGEMKCQWPDLVRERILPHGPS